MRRRKIDTTEYPHVGDAELRILRSLARMLEPGSSSSYAVFGTFGRALLAELDEAKMPKPT